MDEIPAAPAENQPIKPPQPPAQTAPGRATGSGAGSAAGCLPAALLLGMIFWIFVTTAASQTITWSLEQQLFEGASNTPDLRWLIALVYSLAILTPALLIGLIRRNAPDRRFYNAFALAAVLGLFLAPARLAGITAALATDLLLIAGAGLFYLLLRMVMRRRGVVSATWRGLGWSLLAAGLLSVPWVLWGALGSIWDVILNLAAALLFGAVAGQVAHVIFGREEGQPPHAQAVLLDGLIAALVLAIMVSGLGVNGNQGLLILAVPALGWAMSALYRRTFQADLGAGRTGANENLPVLGLLAGLAAFWPMAFIDPDELAAVISLGPGELIQWANLAAFVGLLLGLLVSLLLVLGRARLFNGRVLPAAAAGLVWLVAIGLYVGLGQPGLFGERLFVILKDQADVSGMAQIQDYNQRRTAVYQALVQKADTSQAGIRQALDGLRIPYQPYYLENALEVQGGPLVRWWLESRPEVDRVLNNPMLRPLPEPLPQSRGAGTRPSDTLWNLKMIGADRVWNELGVTGKGIVVGQSDSGAQGDHPELAAAYRGRDGKNTYNWFDPWYHSPAPTDIGGHGTHTLGTILGSHVGVAPGAQWIGCVNLARNLGNPALYLDCMQFMLAPFPPGGSPLHDGRPELGAQILNNSWGCPPVEGCDPDALLAAVKALRAAGIFVVASAGNEGSGGCGSVSEPLALYGQVYSVGAVDPGGALTSFSSIGPVTVDGSQRVKPDIAAPGEDVTSAFPGGTYASLSGTSMAGPHVVGVVALMWSANPKLIGNIDRTQQILDATAAPYNGPLPQCVTPGHPNDGVGYGVVNAYEAVRLAMGK